MRKSTFDAELTALLQANPALERHIPAKTLWMRTPAIVGEFYTMIIALDRAEQERFYAAVGNRVEALARSDFGGVRVDALAPGAWRWLTEAEVAEMTRKRYLASSS